MEKVQKIIPPPAYASQAHVRSMQEYQKKYHESIEDPDKFWAKIAQEFEWYEKWKTVREYRWNKIITLPLTPSRSGRGDISLSENFPSPLAGEGQGGGCSQAIGMAAFSELLPPT